MIKYKSVLIIVAGLLLISFARAPRVAQPPEVKVAEKPKAPEAKTSWEQQWEDLIKEAQREGRLSIYSGLEREAAEVIRKDFGEKYKIALEILSGQSRQLNTKIFMERQNGLYIPDLYIEGPTSPILEYKPKRIIQPLDGVVFRPDVLDNKLWWGKYGPYFDKDHMIGGGTRNAQPQILINTNMVQPDEVSSYNDLLDPRWKGKIVLTDPLAVGGASTQMHFTLMIMGEDYIRKLADQVGPVISDKRLVTEWVARGRYPIAFAASDSMVQEFQLAGVTNLDMISFKEGSGATSTGAVVIFDPAPHPNAAKLFVNWFLTKEAQEAYVTAAVRVSRRLDVPDAHLPSYRRMKEGVKYIMQDEEYYSKIVDNQPLIDRYFEKLKK